MPTNFEETPPPFYFYLIAIIIGILIALIITETYFTLFNPQQLYDKCHLDNMPSFIIENPFTGYTFKPNLHICKYEPDTNQRITWTTNNAGFRMTRNITITKPKNNTRILLVGDSFTEGSDADDTETIAAFLEKLLPKNYEVINLGRGSTATSQQYAHFKEIGLKYSPDIIILFFYPNDFYGNFGDSLVYSFNADKTLNLTPLLSPPPLLTPRTTRTKPLAFLTRTSHTVAFLYSFYEQHTSKQQWSLLDLSFPTILSTHIPRWSGNFLMAAALLEEFNKLVTKNKGTFMFVYIPTKYQFEPQQAIKLLAETEQKEMEHTKIIPNYPDLFFLLFSEKTQIPYLDLFYHKEFSQNYRDLYFKKNPHTNAKGNEVIARAVYQKLAPHINLTQKNN